MNAIEMKHVTKTYPSFTLEDVTLTLPCGCILGLIGENGAGKSTTIGLLMHAIQKDAGEIHILGTNNEEDGFLHTKEDIGVVLDEACFPGALNVRKINRLMACAYKNWQEDLFFDYIRRFSLPETKAFKEYSKGMKMERSIAAALSHQPKLLIMDEPTSGLDPIVRNEIIDLFHDFTKDPSHSMLISSHILSDLEKISDYIAYLHHGKLLFCEEKDLLLEKYGILHVTKAMAKDVPEDAILFRKESLYATELFVRRTAVSDAFEVEPANIEQIMLYYAKKEA